MKLPIYQVDAFASEVFRGNPAAVVPYVEPLSTELMQSIAMENNLSETAFIQSSGPGHYRIRWFTPTVEVDLCGHATLAAAWVVINELEPGLTRVLFDSGVGRLEVDAREGRLILDFPSRPPRPIEIDPALVTAMGKTPLEVLKARDLVLVYRSEAEVLGLRPDFVKLAAASTFGVLATAKGNTVDFVSRCFFPAVGIDEDPVTGSAHCSLIPFWAERLGRTALAALQRSARGGELFCELHGDRVHIGGRVVPYLKGEISV
ncbi:MAG: PhzF family phenazine biosynthesis protein [Vicinamibacteria bacterium]|nr:PhzF family phenazine biosynthesis protein [Vicinamibacteria bacterium]